MYILMMILFIALLGAILFMVYKMDLLTRKDKLPRAIMEECWNGKERRKYDRFEKNLDVIYMIKKKPYPANKANTVNISEGGMKLRLDEKLAKGTIVDLKVIIPDTDKTAELEARVAWFGDGEEKDSTGKRFFHAGMEFIAAKPPTGDHLFDYIRSIISAP